MVKNYNLILDEDLNENFLEKKIFIHNFFLEIHKNKKKYHQVCSHPWNDNENFNKDSKYLQDLKPKLTKSLSIFLNKYHKKSFSYKFWEIILGYWVHSFSMMMLERWRILENLPYKGINYTIRVKKIEEEELIPQTLDEHNNIFYLSEYSSFFFQKIIDFKYKENFSVKKITCEKKIDTVRNKFNYKKPNLKGYILKIFFFFFRKKILNQKYSILRSYLGLFDEIKLNIALRQFPTFIKNNYFLCKPDVNLRSKIKIDLQFENSFEKFLIDNLFYFIPISFLEGFEIEKKILDQIPLPKKPLTVFSSNIISKSLLSRYCAEKVENGSKLILASHGGCYGTFKNHFMEDQEVLISDKYLSWGWENQKNKKIQRIGIIRPISSKIKINNGKYLTMIVPSNSCFENCMESWDDFSNIKASIQGGQVFDSQFRIINNLSAEIKNNLLIRFYPRNFGRNENKIFKIYNPKIMIDKMDLSYEEILSKTKIFLSPYLGTGYLETLAKNIPTIIFTSKKTDVIRDEAKQYYNLLKDVNIYFDDEKKLSDHLNQNWNYYENWWNSEKLQKNRVEFCNNYAFINKNKVKDIKNILLNN